jgi:GT2 family glycosyltransferase
MRDEFEAGRVSVVVLNWNSGTLGSAAVASALAQTWPDVEVIVVDNASSDDSLAVIRSVHPDVMVLANDANLGFARGMNCGIAIATGEFVLPLNCDAELAPDYVEILVGVLRDDPRAAAAGGRVESDRVGASGPLSVTQTMRTRNLPLTEPRRCDKLNGACPLFRRVALDSVHRRFGGPYDPSYDMYGEDVDLALTLGRSGWRFRFEPSAVARHVRSYGSAPRVADRRGRLRTSTLANRHRNIVRHAPGPWWARSALAVVQDAGFTALRLARGDMQAPGDVGRAWSRVVRNLRSDLAKRRQLASPGWLVRMESAESNGPGR